MAAGCGKAHLSQAHPAFPSPNFLSRLGGGILRISSSFRQIIHAFAAKIAPVRPDVFLCRVGTNPKARRNFASLTSSLQLMRIYISGVNSSGSEATGREIWSQRWVRIQNHFGIMGALPLRSTPSVQPDFLVFSGGLYPEPSHPAGALPGVVAEADGRSGGDHRG